MRLSTSTNIMDRYQKGSGRGKYGMLVFRAALLPDIVLWI